MTEDSSILSALLLDERLSESERDAFEGMNEFVKKGGKLSKKQRDWAEDKWKNFELDSDEAQNLMSSGKVPRGKEVRMGYDVMPKPLKPPRRANG